MTTHTNVCSIRQIGRQIVVMTNRHCLIAYIIMHATDNIIDIFHDLSMKGFLCNTLPKIFYNQLIIVPTFNCWGTGLPYGSSSSYPYPTKWGRYNTFFIML
jgi:hypothetical protein